MKVVEQWASERLHAPTTLARWGDFGIPVLVFPTGGGDAEEIERNGLVDACGQLLADGRIKLYSVDNVAGRSMIDKMGSAEHRTWMLNQFHDYIRYEVVPAIYSDLGGHTPGVIATGASIGAFNSVAVLCRYPDVFSAAIGMSGTYRIERFYDPAPGDHMYFASPVQFLPGLNGSQLDQLRSRFAVLASGEGAWEDIGESWHMASVLGGKGVPNRVDNWGPEWSHDWHTWRAMLPQYLDELT